MHAWFRHPQNLPVMAYTHRRKKPSASSKSECLEEEGLKHLFLITSSNCFINVVYLVSVSLEIYSRNVSVSTYLTFLWSSGVSKICKVSLFALKLGYLQKRGKYPKW